MAILVNMPRLSDTMEEGVVAKWLKQVGDKIEEGDILAEIETDKATMEFESFNEGTLLHIGVQEGETSPVDVLLAIIGEEGEDISEILNGAAATSQEVTSEDTTKEISKEQSDTAIPEGVQVISMPRLSDTMEEGTVASWLKNIGDKIEEGDILAEIETDKATMEFESFYEGVLLYIGVGEGESAKVDSLLTIIGPEGTDVSALVTAHKEGTISSDTIETTTETSTTETVQIEEQTAEVSKSNNTGGRIFASPLAKKIAKDKGINLADVKGSGENGRIVKKDVENYTPAPAAAAAVEATPTQTTQTATPLATYTPVGEESYEEVKNSQMRKVIAKRLGESKFTAPHYYLTIELDMDSAIASRKTINALPDTKVSFNDMIVKACAMALKKHPQVNTSWNGDTTRYNHHIHVGVAVAVDDGLLVPVLKFTDQMSLTQIGGNVRDLAGKARTKKIAPNEMEGSTFTISNLGMFGIQEFTSIINQPNSAILSVGAIEQKPVVKEGQIVVGNTMKVTLACDHRTVDGATGAQFLQTVRAYIENPVTMLA
ncbi:pyruvate dehydrogenase complex dihydrolipoamide acetyltransferase [Flavobacteriaceae bacterium]|nr:pyruvate dehydrogenase complex dihydrolipoamide acetyltransferase [Flavobacteriaceae bacterium]